MTIFGSQHSGTDPLHKSDGIAVDAGLRRFNNSVDLAVEGGGTSDSMIVAELRQGMQFFEFRLASTANLSGINFTLGTADDADKYGTSFAGPNNGVVTIALPAVLALPSLSGDEQILLTPSGNLPATGVIVTDIVISKR